MSVLKLSEISDKELATRLLTTTGRLEPHCEELARRLLAWCEAEFLIDAEAGRMFRTVSCGGGYFDETEIPSHQLLWDAGMYESDEDPAWWEEPAAGEA